MGPDNACKQNISASHCHLKWALAYLLHLPTCYSQMRWFRGTRLSKAILLLYSSIDPDVCIIILSWGRSPVQTHDKYLSGISYAARRFKNLKNGRLMVVAHMDSLPASLHDPSSYVVDVNHVSVGHQLLDRASSIHQYQKSRIIMRTIQEQSHRSIK